MPKQDRITFIVQLFFKRRSQFPYDIILDLSLPKIFVIVIMSQITIDFGTKLRTDFLVPHV